MSGNNKQLVAACCISSAASVVYMVAPLIIGGAMESGGLNAGAAGGILAAYFSGFTSVAASGFLWVHRFPARSAAIPSLILIAAGLACAAISTGLAALVASMAIAGAGAGACYVISVALISATEEPDRNFGFALASQLVLGGILLFTIPAAVAPNWGFSGSLALISASVLLIIMVTPWIRQRPAGQPRVLTDAASAAPIYPAIGGTIGLFIWFAGLSAMWGFLERIGAGGDLDPVSIGTVLSLSIIPGMVGALAAAAIGDRFGRRLPHVCSAVIILLAAIVLGQGVSLGSYALAVTLVVLGWNFWLAYLLGALASADTSGRFSALYTAALGLGAATGPVVAGLLVTGASFTPVLLVGVFAIVIGLGAALWLLGALERIADIPDAAAGTEEV